MVPDVTAPTLLLPGDALDVLPGLPESSIDAVVTDPPYGLCELPPRKVATAVSRWLDGDTLYVPEAGAGFMGARWDRFVPPPGLWELVLRAMKPGAHAAVFAGARTVDLMGMSMRLAGFEVRDQLQWLYGNGLPKAKGLLKPGFEPIILARKPFRGSTRANQAAWGTGTLSTEAARIPFTSAADEAESKNKNRHGEFGTLHGGNAVYGDYSMLGVRQNYNPPGRWPANVTLSHDPGCEQAGAQTVRSNQHHPAARGTGGIGSNGHRGQAALDSHFPSSETVEVWRCAPDCPIAELDRQSDRGLNLGGASRFFYCTKASTEERPSYTKPDGTVVQHDTVKPLALMQWLCRLLTPAGGTVLDCFAGSGTTGEAALLEGIPSVLVEGWADYLPLIEQRIARHRVDAA